MNGGVKGENLKPRRAGGVAPYEEKATARPSNFYGHILETGKKVA